ncbi:MAG: lectin-like domain-containing protein [Nonlabens sp.]|uniref:lectin-like domain-containing protein n=1 Tax=Nonlabens sp. TaxID=1888209 RepID=UPI003EF17693
MKNKLLLLGLLFIGVFQFSNAQSWTTISSTPDPVTAGNTFLADATYDPGFSFSDIEYTLDLYACEGCTEAQLLSAIDAQSATYQVLSDLDNGGTPFTAGGFSSATQNHQFNIPVSAGFTGTVRWSFVADIILNSNLVVFSSSTNSATTQAGFVFAPATVTVTAGCGEPTGLAASNIDFTSSDLSVTAGGALNGSAQFIVMDSGVPPNVATAAYDSGSVASFTVNASGLTAGTTYDAYVRGNCPATSTVSGWAGPVSFTTLSCDPVTNLTVIPDTNSSAISVAYTAGAGATDYQYTLVDDFGNDVAGYSGISVGTATSFTITGLPEGESYSSLSIRSDCGGGNFAFESFGGTSGDIVTGAAPGEVNVALSPTSADEDSAVFDFTFARTGSTANSLTVQFTKTDGAGFNATDVSGTPNFTSITIPASQTSAVLQVNINSDTDVESDEFFTIEITADAAYTIGSLNTATATILNDDSLDVDGDGVLDNVDVDNDNDGITDCTEKLLEGKSIDQLFVLDGDAVINPTDNQELILTNEATFELGSAFSNNQFDFGSNFDFSFEVTFSEQNAVSGERADGIAIVFQNDPAGANATGNPGGGLGAQTIQNGIALELDIFNNGASWNDLAADHGSIWDTDTYDNSAAGRVLLSDAKPIGEIEDGLAHTVFISWDATNESLFYTVDGVLAGSLTTPSFATTYFGGDKAFLGFTAATGGSVSEQKVRFTDICEVPVFVDTDMDGIPNQLDLDSDGDGIPDNVEAQTTSGWLAPAVVNATGTEAGLASNYGTGLVPVDTESQFPNFARDEDLDYLTLDADSDGTDDRTESGITAAMADANGNGLDDASEDLAVNTMMDAYNTPNGNIVPTAAAGGPSGLAGNASSSANGDWDYRWRDFNFTYNNGWIDNPEGYILGIEDVLIQEGTATINDGFIIKDLTLGFNNLGASELVLNTDITVRQKVSLNTTSSGDGYIIHNNAGTSNESNGVELSVGNLNATLNNYRITDPQGVQVGEFKGVPGFQPAVPAILTFTGNLDLAGGGMTNATGPIFGPLTGIVFASTATETAHITGAFALDSSSVENAANGEPNIVAQRYISGNRAFRFLASPVSGSSIFDTWQEGGLEPAGFGTHITGVQSANVTNLSASDAGETDAATGLDLTASGNPSMFSFGGAAWSAVANTNNTNHIIGNGYRMMVRGDRNIDLNDNASGAGVTTTLRANGALENGDKSLPTTTGFNLLGNPYQSFMDMATVGTSNTTGFVYYWDPTLGTQGAYTTVTLPGGSATAGSNATNVIEPGQAFFMEATAAGTVDFELADRLSADDAIIFNTPQLTNSIELTVFDAARYTAGQTAQDGLIIEFGATENLGLDTRDARKFNNIDENISVVHDATGDRLAFERRTLPSVSDVIELNFSNQTVSNYTFEAVVNGLPGMDVYLKDNFTGNLSPLSQGTTLVDVTVDINDANSSALDRFEIVFQNVTLSVDDNLSLESAVKLYPNPVSGDAVTVVIGSDFSNDVSYALYNSLGQLITQKDDIQLVGGKLIVENLSSLTKGVYLLNITAGAETVTRRIIKK